MADSDFLRTRQRYYADILNELFDPTLHMESSRFFEFVCALVRVGGLELGGIDPWYESKALIDDLRNIASLEFPTDHFPDPAKTEIRLALLAYCTLTEMDLPYELLANLLRLRAGSKYHIDPFFDLSQHRRSKKGQGQFGAVVPPTTNQKLRRISELAAKAGLAAVSTALAETHDAAIRNAVYHSDFVIQSDSLLVRKAFRLSKHGNCYTPRVPLQELDELITNAFAFYGALFSLYERCRLSFNDFKGAFVPYDVYHKGIMECLFDDEDRIIGFRVYWPNGTCGEYARTKEACVNCNLRFEEDGSVNFMVGLIASRRGAFSPLVEHDCQPNYAVKPGSQQRPHWPADLRPYKLA